MVHKVQSNFFSELVHLPLLFLKWEMKRHPSFLWEALSPPHLPPNPSVPHLSNRKKAFWLGVHPFHRAANPQGKDSLVFFTSSCNTKRWHNPPVTESYRSRKWKKLGGGWERELFLASTFQGTWRSRSLLWYLYSWSRAHLLHVTSRCPISVPN